MGTSGWGVGPNCWANRRRGPGRSGATTRRVPVVYRKRRRVSFVISVWPRWRTVRNNKKKGGGGMAYTIKLLAAGCCCPPALWKNIRFQPPLPWIRFPLSHSVFFFCVLVMVWLVDCREMVGRLTGCWTMGADVLFIQATQKEILANEKRERGDERFIYKRGNSTVWVRICRCSAGGI